MAPRLAKCWRPNIVTPNGGGQDHAFASRLGGPGRLQVSDVPTDQNGAGLPGSITTYSARPAATSW